MSECHELMMRYSRYFETTPHTHIFISIYPSYVALAGTFVCGLSKVDQHPGQGKRQWNGGRRWFQGSFIVLPDHSIWLLFQKGFTTTCWLWKSRAVISAGVHFRSRDASRMMIYYNYLQSFLYNNMMYIYQKKKYIYTYIHWTTCFRPIQNCFVRRRFWTRRLPTRRLPTHVHGSRPNRFVKQMGSVCNTLWFFG